MYYPDSAQDHGSKKAIIIISIVTLLLIGVWAIILVILHNNKSWLFRPYERPPLPGQNGEPQPLPATGNALALDTTQGKVVHLGVPIEYTDAQSDNLQAQASHEASQWETWRNSSEGEPVHSSWQSIL
jgi:hypothetical protein